MPVLRLDTNLLNVRTPPGTIENLFHRAQWTKCKRLRSFAYSSKNNANFLGKIRCENSKKPSWTARQLVKIGGSRSPLLNIWLFTCQNYALARPKRKVRVMKVASLENPYNSSSWAATAILISTQYILVKHQLTNFKGIYQSQIKIQNPKVREETLRRQVTLEVPKGILA